MSTRTVHRHENVSTMDALTSARREGLRAAHTEAGCWGGRVFRKPAGVTGSVRRKQIILKIWLINSN
jgi:hypothetical protein